MSSSSDTISVDAPASLLGGRRVQKNATIVSSAKKEPSGGKEVTLYLSRNNESDLLDSNQVVGILGSSSCSNLFSISCSSKQERKQHLRNEGADSCIIPDDQSQGDMERTSEYHQCDESHICKGRASSKSLSRKRSSFTSYFNVWLAFLGLVILSSCYHLAKPNAISSDIIATSNEKEVDLALLSKLEKRVAQEETASSADKIKNSEKKQRNSSCPPCEEPGNLCAPYGEYFYCQRGKEVSERCYVDSMCFSGSCDNTLEKCSCPNPSSCTGCSSPGVPCLRFEHQYSQPLEICGLYAKIKKAEKGKLYYADLFDVGAAHSDNYTNMEKVIGYSSSRYCLSVVPFQEGSAALLPPAFVQTSVLTEDSQNIRLVAVKGTRKTLPGLQLFINDNWIAYISKVDVGLKEKDEFNVKKDKIVTIEKDVYPRLHVESIGRLRNSTFINSLQEVTAVIPVPSGEEILDFDLPPHLGVDFVGEGPTKSELYIMGDIHAMGRINFKKLRVSFDLGSLKISGPVMFQSSQIVDVNRCPLSFLEFNGICMMISTGIEQADDAQSFCESLDGTLASETDAKYFLQNNINALGPNSVAWIKPKSLETDCSFIHSSGDSKDFLVDAECDRFLQVICSSHVRYPLTGEKYTSYYSDHFVGTYVQDYYKRAVDIERIPYHLGGTLSFVQNDITTYEADGEITPVVFTAPDAVPRAVSVNLELHSGNASSINIALDTFNTTGHQGHKWYLDGNVISLPTKIQLHAKEDAVCVKSLDLLVHNETDHRFVVASFPAKMVAECLDYNVCTEQDTRMCRRSLMFYDEQNECARLETESAAIPRDLSIDLLSLGCSRLTTWHHPNLGSPFYIEAQVDGIAHPFTLKEYLGDRHKYVFNSSVFRLKMDESNVLPVDFLVSGGRGLLRSLEITRYGLTISGTDFSDLWDCINICDAFANPSALHFGPQRVVECVLDLLAPFECQKLVEVSTTSGSGRSVCTSPPIAVSNMKNISEELALMSDLSTQFKTLNVNVTGRLVDEENIDIPTNRGLRIYRDIDNGIEDGSIENVLIHVTQLAELYLSDLTINGTTKIIADSLARVEISGGDVSIDDLGVPFLTNAGETILESMSIHSSTILKNIESGKLQQMYVTYYDSASFENSYDGTIQVNRLSVYEEFLSMDANEGLGTLQLSDARRLYKTIDDEDDILCQGHANPDRSVLDVETRECQQLCEDEFICSGAITHFNDGIPSCGLCLREEPCTFSCADYSGGAYYRAESKFNFMRVSSCPYISRAFKIIRDVTLEQCKLYCNYYRSCEGFKVITGDEHLSRKSCELIADLDFAENCSPREAVEVYIPYTPHSTHGFHNIFGNLLASSPIALYSGFTGDKCAAVCKKTISCASFQQLNSTCSLFDDNTYDRSDKNNGFFLTLDEPFPLKRYMAYQSCYLPGSYASFNIKTVKRCKDLCNEDYSCVGFSFRPLQTLFENNCELYDSPAMVNGVFGPDLGCQRQPLRRKPRHGEKLISHKRNADKTIGFATNQKELVSNRKHSESQEPSLTPSEFPSLMPSPSPSATPSLFPSDFPSLEPSLSMEPSPQPSMHPSILPSISMIPSVQPSLSIRPSQLSETYDVYVAFSTDTFTLSRDRSFETVLIISDIVEDECQTLCFYDTLCVAVRYNVTSSVCEIGTLSSGSSNNNPYLALDSLPTDEASRYLASNACYVGERLHDHENEVIIYERSSGYHHMPETCSSSSASDVDELFDLSPAECSLLCNNDSSCVGFIHYVDHGGALNSEKIGKCKKVSSFNFGSCDAVGENSDFYLRADIGATCQAQCNVHQLCSSFVFAEGVCKLYSDISLLDNCETNKSPERIHIGLSYRSRDGMVALPGQCFVEYEDLRISGCKNFAGMLGEGIQFEESTSMTPWECQQSCKRNGETFYAVHNTNRCSCGSENFFNLPSSDACNSTCPGDPLQLCGGVDVAIIGETGLPIPGLTLAQCKRECFFSGSCEAIQFDHSKEGNTSECELRSIGNFKSCDKNHTIYVESLEHYYDSPRSSYVGSKSIYNATADLKQDCQKLCDAFHSCEAINYTDILSVHNCEILGGEMVPLKEEEIAEGVQVAKDVTLYTLGFAPDRSEELASVNTTFDLDECRTLCDQHVNCGSVEFSPPSCRLFAKSAFADVLSLPTNHYIDYSYFVDPSQEFVLATGLCIAKDSDVFPLTSRETVLSSHDCAKHCNSMSSCSVFTYNKETKSCRLFDENVTFTFSDCDSETETYTMFTRSKFVEKPGACLQDEDELDSYLFYLKTPYECAALCDKWFNCRSFRSDEAKGMCRLFRSEQFIDSCGNLDPSQSPGGRLYVYYSDYQFTRLDNNFCVGSNTIASIDNLPIEACKSICQKSLDCLSFQHTQVGLCVLYASADFSGICSDDDDRDLYITYRNVVDPASRYLFNELDSCFDVTGLASIDVSENECKGLCESLENCFGFQEKNKTTIFECVLMDQGQLPPAVQCEEQSEAFLKTKRNPYKLLPQTCLQNRIAFGADRDLVFPGKEDYNVNILDKEDYECMALCDAHPSCRYFLYGNNTSISTPRLRECILFEAQPIEVDDCDNERGDAGFINDYKDLPAYVNGRTFIDQITWFGEPERNFANITDLSYQECASLCDALEECDAFIHTWNYRRAPLGSGRPLLFTNTRLTRLDFKSNGDHESLFLMFNLTTLQLVLKKAESDDDVKKQLLSPELLGDGSLKLKFWSSSGKCLSAGGPFQTLLNEFNQRVIQENFRGSQPACQKLNISDCDEDAVIKFKDIGPARFNQKIRLAYEDSTGSGCIGIHRSKFKEDVDTVGKTEELQIPPILKNITGPTKEVEIAWCLLEVDTFPCENRTNHRHSCSNRTVQIDDKNYDIIETCSETEEYCVTLNPTDQPSASFSPSGINSPSPSVPSIPPPSGVVVRNCTFTTTTNTTQRSFLQKNSEDILSEMYSYFDGQCHAADGVELFSISYSGNACDFNNDIAEFPSQEFTWASDAVILKNTLFKSCLSEELNLIPCESVTTTKWVYLFTTGHLYFANASNNMMCLTRAMDNVSVTIESCDKDNYHQSWEFNAETETLVAVNLVVNGEDQCLSAASSTGRVIVTNCTAPESTWSTFEECRLNSRERTSGMKIESVESPGKCIDIDYATEDAILRNNCEDAASWYYYYNGNSARLQLLDASTDQCLGRRSDNYEIIENESDVGLAELIDLPTGLVPCTKDKVVYWRNTIAGEENNIFQWSLINNKTGTAIEPYFCLDVRQEQQIECPSDLKDARTWRKFGDEGDATEISVKPSATLQDISDPEVLFQFYLFSAEGKRSRILRSRMAALVRDVALMKNLITSVLRITTESLNLVEMVQTPVSEINDNLKEGARSFKVFGIILKPFTKIPKIGPIFTKVNKPVKAVEKASKTGSNHMGKAEEKIKKARFPLETFQLILEKVETALPIVNALDVFVDTITRSSFCAYREGNLEHYELTQKIIGILASKIKISVSLIEDIRSPLSSLNSFKANMKKYLLKPIKGFKAATRSMFSVIDNLSFLETIANYKVPVPYPAVKFGIKCKWYGCWPTIGVSFRTEKIGLKDIGEFIDDVIGTIKKIPGVGWAVKEVEDSIESVIKGLFDAISIPIPNFEINLPFLDDLEGLVQEAKQELDDFLDFFTSILDLDGAINELIEPVLDVIEKMVPAVDIDFLNCTQFNTTEECLFEKIVNFITIPSTDRLIPEISVGDIDITLPEDFSEIFRSLSDDFESVADSILDLFDDMRCDRYETLPVNLRDFMDDNFMGFTGSATFPLPSCPIKVEVCTGLRFPNMDGLSSKIIGIVDNVISRKRRKLGLLSEGSKRSLSDDLCQDKYDGTGSFVNGGISIPIPIEELYRRGSNRARQQWSTKINKMFKFADMTSQSFEKHFAKDFFGIKGFFGMKFGSPDLKLLMGCDFGKFRAELSLGPLIDFTGGIVTGPSHTSDAKAALKYGDKLDISKKCLLPGFRSQPDCVEARKDQKDAKKKFAEQIKLVEEIHDMLCYIDFQHVTRDLEEQFMRAAERSVRRSENALLSGVVTSSDLFDYLEKFQEEDGYFKVASAFSILSDSRRTDLKKSLERHHKRNAQRQRDDLLKRIENELKCKDDDDKIISCHEWLTKVYKPSVSESTKDSCRHLYHPKYILEPQTALNLTIDVLRETTVSVGSYNKLYGPLLPINTYSRQSTPDFVYNKGSTGFSPLAFFGKWGLNKGFKSIGTLIAAIENVGEEKPDTNETISTWEVIRNSTSDFIDITVDIIASGCMGTFARNNKPFMFELLPSFKLKNLYGVVELFQEAVEESKQSGLMTVIERIFYERCYKLGFCQQWYNYRPISATGEDEELITAALDAKKDELKGFGGSTLVYSNRIIFELKFSLVSMTINLVEDEQSRREIVLKKKAIICEGRACFYPFENNPTLVYNPQNITLNTTCD